MVRIGSLAAIAAKWAVGGFALAAIGRLFG
jgi:hypothetical protein